MRSLFHAPEHVAGQTATASTPVACAPLTLAIGANGDADPIRTHVEPWGRHRQGGFVDPFGHVWLIGDRSPLKAYP